MTFNKQQMLAINNRRPCLSRCTERIIYQRKLATIERFTEKRKMPIIDRCIEKCVLAITDRRTEC